MHPRYFRFFFPITESKDGFLKVVAKVITKQIHLIGLIVGYFPTPRPKFLDAIGGNTITDFMEGEPQRL